MEHFDLIIIGGGAAGFGAAVYAGRYELNVVLFEGQKPGGETATGGKFENYPGIVSIDGYDLYQQFRAHAAATGARIMQGVVTAIARDGGCFAVTVDGKETHRASSVVFAHGQSRRHLGLPKEEALTGKGVSYCATCDGPLYKGKTVAVVGGGDASVKGVNLLAEYAKKIYLIMRGSAVQAEPANYTIMKQKGEVIEVLPEIEVKELVEEGGALKHVALSKPYRGQERLTIDGLFVEIGAAPDRALPSQIGVALTPQGYIHVDQFMRTNVPGVFAAGDITDASGSFRQAIMAAAQGSMAATSAYEYLQKNPQSRYGTTL
ncbi:hypothetical protein A3J43_02840 [Candidatus Uhrbacteria bacterium RIFCSPHIGHO2_12_FULL_54_23]|uniref:FAD/NAD(P)-binding domain-containing protein n=3 Tax=Candidatus Uhriibacteriota TaxID=1752732 RepID=A0A1F7UJG4_9BACT|nr:MAG: hypothetical protein A3J43_02840 [Candidatus Uhrbacteria bacterium RIFCSPHIGHO2_12_FULL_54_23]OGL85524.1 MAG: hypothetical protein A3B36_00490 [Candidatus Uhrbacteria bacterium RIFCSPLOWO2_01_FULL_55_36]OGL89611.1 MAG: hypothetical protein A3J36_01070 [Candidatus Uhrbacteria bacterium RIFCSPLOWO2_02_FULL_54_37]